MKVTFYTLGCKVNQYETEAMREAFAAAGHTPVPSSAPFDAAVINSCTVTAESDRKTRQLLHKVRRENPEAIIILTHCPRQRALNAACGNCGGGGNLKPCVVFRNCACGNKPYLLR